MHRMQSHAWASRTRLHLLRHKGRAVKVELLRAQLIKLALIGLLLLQQPQRLRLGCVLGCGSARARDLLLERHQLGVEIRDLLLKPAAPRQDCEALAIRAHRERRVPGRCIVCLQHQGCAAKEVVLDCAAKERHGTEHLRYESHSGF